MNFVKLELWMRKVELQLFRLGVDEETLSKLTCLRLEAEDTPQEIAEIQKNNTQR